MDTANTAHSANSRSTASDSHRLYTPQADERQLSWRAISTGCAIGVVVAAMNISIGLQIGWTFGGSILAAVLGYAIFRALRPARKFGVLETNLRQTTASAAGSMVSAGGMVSYLPALALIGPPVAPELSYLQLTLWSLAVGFLGVFFAVPLRQQMIVVEQLRFPTGTATAQTIVAIFAEGAEALRKARILLGWALVAAIFTLLSYDWSEAYWGSRVANPSLSWLGSGAVFLAAWGFRIYVAPVMLGVGLLVGPRVGWSLLAGAICGWLVLGYGVLYQQGWVDAAAIHADGNWSGSAIMSYSTGVRGWIIWPGVAIMVADALTSLALSWRTVVAAFQRPAAGGLSTALDAGTDTPRSWWLAGLGGSTLLVVCVAYFVFAIPPWLTLIAVALSSLLAVIAVRSMGETDLNPTGTMGKVNQLVFGGIAPGNIVGNLMAGGISTAGAAQAADVMQDLKTGYLLGAAPRKQVIAQCVGVLAGVLVTVPIYLLFQKVYDIGGATGGYPAPAAHSWKAVAELLTTGFSALPPRADWAVLLGIAFGMLIPLVRRYYPSCARWLPSGLAFGIAFIVPPYFSIAIFTGSVVYVIWRRRRPAQHEALVFAVASGVLAGTGVTNVLTALFELVSGYLRAL